MSKLVGANCKVYISDGIEPCDDLVPKNAAEAAALMMRPTQAWTEVWALLSGGAITRNEAIKRMGLK